MANVGQELDADEELATCEDCGSMVEEEEGVCWKSIEDDQLHSLCLECLQEKQPKPIFFGQLSYYQTRLNEVCVLAKHGEEWLRGTVWEYDAAAPEISVEWDNKSKGETLVKKQDVKILFTFSGYGDEIPLTHQYPTLQAFLEKRGHTFTVKGLKLKENLIPQELRLSLMKNLDVIAERPQKDFHPGSDNKVLNLFHPSLFCYVKGVSVLKDGIVEVFNENQLIRNYFGRVTRLSRYQWLPANFQIDRYGQVRITSYINGLGPREAFPELYEDIERVFEHLLPFVEDCLPQSQGFQYQTITLKDRQLQVIVKAANYILQPGQFHEGVWHVEGMSHEHIIATAIYYYDASENMVDKGLTFRREIEEDEEEEVLMEYTHEYPAPFEIEEQCIDLGTVQTGKRKCVVFPNNYQHKLVGLENSSDTEVAYRKMICFFLVDPQQKIISTEDIRDQNWTKQKQKVAVELQKVALRKIGRSLPEVAAQKILQGAKVGFTLEEAQQHRVGLMRDRKFYKDEMNREILRDIELCEH